MSDQCAPEPGLPLDPEVRRALIMGAAYDLELQMRRLDEETDVSELAILANDPSALEAKADPVRYVVLACERAKAWLTDALENGDIEAIVETKSQAEAIRVYTQHKQMGKDAQLAATEIVRRAERGIGVAIRRGQEAGEITVGPEAGVQAKRAKRTGDTGSLKPTPVTYAKSDELNGSGSTAGIYQMTDGVTDEEFESGIEEAKAEGNLSRANVVRKIDAQPAKTITRKQRAEKIRELAEQGYSSRQMAVPVGVNEESIRHIARVFEIDIPADKAIRNTRRHDSNRIVQETVNALAGLAIGVDLIKYEELDVGQACHAVTSLDESLKALNLFRKNIRKVTA